MLWESKLFNVSFMDDFVQELIYITTEFIDKTRWVLRRRVGNACPSDMNLHLLLPLYSAFSIWNAEYSCNPNRTSQICSSRGLFMIVYSLMWWFKIHVIKWADPLNYFFNLPTRFEIEPFNSFKRR